MIINDTYINLWEIVGTLLFVYLAIGFTFAVWMRATQGSSEPEILGNVFVWPIVLLIGIIVLVGMIVIEIVDRCANWLESKLPQ